MSVARILGYTLAFLILIVVTGFTITFGHAPQ